LTRTATIPPPPDEILDASPGAVLPALELEAWVQSELLAPDRPLSNYDHDHLRSMEARMAFLWCNETLRRKGRRVLGTAQLGEPSGGDAWTKALRRDHLQRLFGFVPDFLITIDAYFAERALESRLPQNLLAVVEHELYHCGQDTNSWGDPRYTPDGDPVWGIKPHDLEEFTGVARRYGAYNDAIKEFVAAANAAPEIGPVQLDGICGTCLKKAA
jgi:hypothetical protein